MKVLYFFFIIQLNFRDNHYLTFKKKEIKKHFAQINQGNDDYKISYYCLNREKKFLVSKGFEAEIHSVSEEYVNIKRDIYPEVVQNIWENVRKFFREITTSPLNNLNYLIDIVENKIMLQLLDLYERFEFINSIIKRERPNVVYFSDESDSFFKDLKNDLDLNNVKFIYLKSQIDFFYKKFNRFLINTWNFFYDFKRYFKYKFKYTKKGISPISREGISVGISAPSYFLYSMEMNSIKNQLKKEGIKFRSFKGIYDMESSPTLAKMKFKYVSSFYLKFIKKYLNNSRITNLLLKDIELPLKEYAYIITKNKFLIEIQKALYIMKNLISELELSEYKIILINTEFRASGKCINYLCKKYRIHVYFIPYCRIPLTKSY